MRPRRSIMLLSVLAIATGLGATPVAGLSAGGPTITATLTDAPDPVTTGKPLRYVTTVSNAGPATITHVELAFPMPAGITAVSATPSTGSCTTQAGEVDCTTGTLAAGRSAEVRVDARADSAGTAVATAQWTADIGQDDPHHYFASQSTTVAAPSPDLVAEYTPAAGDTLTTDPGTGATASNPQVTTATIPASVDGTPATLAESNASGPGDACGPSAKCFGQISTITIGQTFTPGNPLRFVLLLDKSEIPTGGVRTGKIPMFHDGIAVPDCTGAAGVASPDPCVVSRTKLLTKDVAIVILSSINGRWRP